METMMGERHSGTLGISSAWSAISFIALSPLVTMAMTEPPRAFTCCMLDMILSWRSSMGAMTTVGRLVVDECDGCVFHLGCGVSFGVDV